tara:strand:+ start:279 stop:488 length:210 start_codon:yes stop_codon:yes gene_type:complete
MGDEIFHLPKTNSLELCFCLVCSNYNLKQLGFDVGGFNSGLSYKMGKLYQFCSKQNQSVILGDKIETEI